MCSYPDIDIDLGSEKARRWLWWQVGGREEVIAPAEASGSPIALEVEGVELFLVAREQL